jgi:probable F420-dependent oxidoreductase
MTARWGMSIPFHDVPLHRQGEVARELEGLGYTDLWTEEGMGNDAFTPLAIAAAVTTTVRLGTAIVPVFTRGPALLAQSAATMAASAPGRFVLGLGSSSDILVGQWNDIPFDRPWSRTRDMVRFLRQALAGGRVDEDYDTFSVHGFRAFHVPDPPVPILVAGLRGRMLSLAGTEADGAVLTLLGAEDVTRVAPIVHGDRGQNSGKEIVARILVAPTEDADRARAAGRRLLAAYLNVPVYRAFHEWLGHTELELTWKLWSEGERQRALEAIPDHVVDALVVHGSPEAQREHLQRFADNGVTTPLVMMLSVGVDPLQAMRDLAPR